ncbi:transcription factor FapR [Aciduricibacillus chroicocephali]|uniref:Transcription factor FapR n=1 Tax=Aciduricibacillus chroicocephali TaxID=3054939 RepID=A0ABY9KYB4_9BACI|nr:transcription factor FapR [Bacillaceae bacterium 44XB]
MKKSKAERQKELVKMIEKTPFVTDDQLASMFGVSIQTIRLDRLELGIPELRERIKSVAKSKWKETVKALPIEDVIGEIIDLELGRRAISILAIGKEHVFSKNRIARGHHLFAQANSLAVAVINDAFALTSKSTVKFTRPVLEGERVVAKAHVEELGERNLTMVEVESFVDSELVFKGQFHMYHSSERREDSDEVGN